MADEATDQEKFDAIKDSPLFAEALNAHGKLIQSQNEKGLIDGATGKAYGNMDAVIKEVLGLEKGDGKTTEQMKALLEELKGLRSTGGKLDETLQAALDKQKGVHDTDFAKAQKTIEDLELANSTLKSKGLKRDITSALSEALQGKTFKAYYSNDDIKELSSSKFGKIIANVKIEDGKQVFYNADGTKRTNSKGVVMTATEVVEEDFGSMFETKTAGGGADADGKYKDAAALEGDKVVIDMSDIKTRGQALEAFNEVMAGNGITLGDEKYIKHFKVFQSENGYKDLPVN